MIWPAPAKALNLKRQAIVLISIDRNYATDQCAFLRPQMQHRRPGFFAYFVLEIFKRCEPGTIFLHLHGAASQQPGERFFEGLAQFHGGKVYEKSTAAKRRKAWRYCS